jgi:prepilin-type processing-associated H-X9-DG protein
LNNGTAANGRITIDPPKDLSGTKPGTSGAKAEYRFLIARHGHGINICFADGSAHFVPLADTYQCTWYPKWNRGAIVNLPSK